jgi:N-acetylneuraminic acid mutarotase
MLAYRIVLPSLLLHACASPDEVRPEPSGAGWSEVAPMPETRQEHAVLAVDGEIWALGGFEGPGVPSFRVEAYDPQTDAWRRLPDLPATMHHLHAAEVDGEVIVAGFLTGFDFEEDGRVFRLPPGGDAWVAGTPMPDGEARGSGITAVVDGEVWVLGGFREGEAVPLVSSYEPVADAWTTRPPLAQPKDHLAGGVVDGTLVAAAGRDGRLSRNSATAEVFDDGGWAEVARLARPRGGVVSTVHDGRLWVFGGEGNDGMFPDVEAYDPSSDTWEAAEDMPTPIHGAGAASVDGAIWIPGGGVAQLFQATDVMQRYVP